MKKIKHGPNMGKTFPAVNSVENFNYNGFGCETLPGFANYEVKEFIEWSTDPGIVLVLCTDGKERRIPTCQLTKELLDTFPEKPSLPKFGEPGHVLFGQSSKS